jgi:hypothetical protein
MKDVAAAKKDTGAAKIGSRMVLHEDPQERDVHAQQKRGRDAVE